MRVGWGGCGVVPVVRVFCVGSVGVSCVGFGFCVLVV